VSDRAAGSGSALGPTYAGKIVTVHVEDAHFRIACDGTEIALHPRTGQRPVTRWKAKILAPKPQAASARHSGHCAQRNPRYPNTNNSVTLAGSSAL
jgi:hypothetical protein